MRQVLLVGLLLAACDSRSVHLSQLHSPVLTAKSWDALTFELAVPVVGGACDVLDGDVVATVNGVGVEASDPGGPEHTVKGRLYGCSPIRFTAPPLPEGPVVFELSDATAKMRLESDTLTSTRSLVLASGGSLARGTTAQVGLSPESDTLVEPGTLGFEASLDYPDGTSLPLSASLDGNAIAVEVPAAAPPGPARLSAHPCSQAALMCTGVTCRASGWCWEMKPLDVTVQ